MDTPCYEWPSRTASGYGQIQSGGRKNRRHWYAHRVIWAMAHGPIPPGMIVRHRCDNPPCVRIDHLELGTYKDNTRDMMDRGRDKHGTLAKQDHPQSKLTQQDVDNIRDRYAQGGVTQTQLASFYGVGQNHISRIIRREAWS